MTTQMNFTLLCFIYLDDYTGKIKLINIKIQNRKADEILIGLCVLLYQVRLVSYLGVLALLCFWSLELEGGGGGKVLLCWYRKNMA